MDLGTSKSHEIMTPRSATEGQEVNSRKADEVFTQHGRVSRPRTQNVASALNGLAVPPSI